MTEDERIEPTGDFDELAAFLDSDEAPEDWMPGAVLDGYLAGIVVSPTWIRPSEWMPMIWGETPFESEDQANWAMAAVMARFNEINQFARGESERPPSFRFDRGPDGEPSVHNWAIGFLKAFSLRADAWSPLSQHETAYTLLTPMFAYITDANGDPGATFNDIPADEQDSYFATVIPDVIQAIYAFWGQSDALQPVETSTPPRRRKVGRNEPCPCGSGRKAKRCCGAG